MPSAAPRPSILVIDDSKAVRRLVAQALSGHACEVHEATNGFTGLYAMERIAPQLLLIDAAMPTMDGVELLTMLKSHGELRHLPVIMLTATTDKKILPRITELGAPALLQKPFTAAAVLAAVLAVLPLKPTAR